MLTYYDIVIFFIYPLLLTWNDIYPEHIHLLSDVVMLDFKFMIGLKVALPYIADAGNIVSLLNKELNVLLLYE